MTRTLSVFVALAAVIACAPAQSRSDSSASVSGSVGSAAQTDTLVGVVREVGADPSTWMSISIPGGASLRLIGDAVASLRSVGGTEVWISGKRQVDEFRVDAFEVRKANGVAVDDGTVSVEQGKAFLTTRAGVRREIPHAPPQLMSSNGARIWVTRPATNQEPTYGVIRRP